MDIGELELTGRAEEIIHILQKATSGMVQTAVTQVVSEYGRDPFLVLVSCILSLRTKDMVSLPASHRLFQLAKNPRDILQLSIEKIEAAIYPVGFYRQKAKNLHEISRELLQNFGGRVPNDENMLLKLKGVGRKTANLVLAEGFLIPALCVDTHVHRISNRLGLVKTKTPDQTEEALKKVLPKKYWVEFNKLLVKWGQNICVPISPFCSKCPILDLCDQISVKSKR